MPSTYTLNNGIELIGTGEQSGTWGDTTNTNLELLDTALDGQVTVTLSSTGSGGSPNTLPISDGSSSNGRNRLVVFNDGSDIGGTVYVQLTPNDAEKIIYVRNSLSGSRSILLFQGTYNASNDYEIPAGTTAIVFFNGGGTGAVAANVFNNAYFDGLRLGSVSVDKILDEDNMASDDPAGLATQQSIKAYVDAQVGTVDTWSEVLANGNTSGATDAVITAGQKITTDTIGETTAAAGVTIDSVLLKDDVVNATDIETSTISANDGTTAINIADSTGAVDIDTSLNVDGTVTSDGLTVDGDAEFNSTSFSSGGKIYLDGTTANAGDDVWDLQFRNTVSGVATDENAGSIRVEATNARRQYDMLFSRSNSGTQADAVRIGFNGDITFYDTSGNASFVYDESAGTTVNDNQDARDFTVKSDGNDAMLYVNGTTDLVGIGHSAPSAILDVKSTTAVVSTLRGTTSSIAYLDITNYATSAVGAGSGIEFRANSSVQERQVGFITADWTDNTDATRDSRMDFHINLNGGTTRMLKLGVSAVSVNAGNHDTNFQVSSVNQDNMLFVDAGNDRVGVGTGSPSEVFTVASATRPRISVTDLTNVKESMDSLLEFDGTDGRGGYLGSVSGDMKFVNDLASKKVIFGTVGTERVAIEADGEVTLESNSALHTGSTATSATTQTAVYSFSATDYTGAKFLVCVTDSTATERYITEVLVTHDGTTAVSTEYGQVATDTALATFDVDISGGNVRLLATPASTNSMTFKVMSTQLLA